MEKFRVDIIRRLESVDDWAMVSILVGLIGLLGYLDYLTDFEYSFSFFCFRGYMGSRHKHVSFINSCAFTL